MTPRGPDGALNSPSNGQSGSQLKQLRRVYPPNKQGIPAEPSQERLTISINRGPYLMVQGHDADQSNIDTDHGSAPLSPTNNAKAQSRSLYGHNFKQSAQINLSDNELADLEKLRHRPDFLNKGLTQSNFAERPAGGQHSGEHVLPGSMRRVEATGEEAYHEGT